MNVVSRTFENAAPADCAVASGEADVRASAREATTIARIEIFDSVSDAEKLWADAAAAGWLGTPFQDFFFLRAWHMHVGRTEGQRPLIIAAFDSAGAPAVLLPFVVRPGKIATIACFAGGKHATFNMALWRPDVAARASRAMLDEIIRLIRLKRPDIDLLILVQQPLDWNGQANPFALFERQPSVNDCPRLDIPKDARPAELVSNSFRRRLRGKERKLEKLGNYRHTVATSQADVDRLLDAFFRYKPERMALQKLPNMFEDEGVQNFVHETCARAVAHQAPPIELHGLESDEEVLAIFAGVADGTRFSMMYNTYTLSENARHSPGLILIRDIVDHYAAKGYRFVDLGTGFADYKALFCKTDENLFDSFVPLTAKGVVAAAAVAFSCRAKRWIKRHPRLLGVLRRLENTMCGIVGCGPKKSRSARA